MVQATGVLLIGAYGSGKTSVCELVVANVGPISDVADRILRWLTWT